MGTWLPPYLIFLESLFPFLSQLDNLNIKEKDKGLSA
jgi:hypothetical protein